MASAPLLSIFLFIVLYFFFFFFANIAKIEA